MWLERPACSYLPAHRLLHRVSFRRGPRWLCPGLLQLYSAKAFFLSCLFSPLEVMNAGFSPLEGGDERYGSQPQRLIVRA